MNPRSANQSTTDRPYERILIIKPSSLGDIVHALPVLAALRDAYPSAHIAWLVGNTFAPLLRDHPLLDETILFDRKRYGKMWRNPRASLDFLRFLKDLRSRRFDLIVDLQGLFRSGFLAYASRAPQRIGFAKARECAWLFYSQRVACPAEAVHAVDRNLCVAAALGLTVSEPRFPLGLQAAETTAVQNLLANAAGWDVDRFTAVIPGARWQSKRWLPERLAALIDQMDQVGLPSPVLLGSPGDRAFADTVLEHCRTDVIDLVGRTNLRELVALIDLADRVICHDSGPMHIAAALNKPLVAIFGPTRPARTGPYCSTAQIIAAACDCAPCRHRRCSHHTCMQDVEVSQVLAAVESIG